MPAPNDCSAMCDHHTAGEPCAPTESRRRRWRWLSLVAAAVLAGAAAGAGTAWAAEEFSDVPASNPFYDEIAWMADTGISGGYLDGTYRPREPVSRQAMSAFLMRLYDLQAGLSDVNAYTGSVDLTSDEVWVTSGSVRVEIPDGTTGVISAIATANVHCNGGDNSSALFFLVPPRCNLRMVVTGRTGQRAESPVWTVAESDDANTEPDVDVLLDTTAATVQVASDSLPAGSYYVTLLAMMDDRDGNTGPGADPLIMTVSDPILRADVLLSDVG